MRAMSENTTPRSPLATRSIRIEPDAWEQFQRLAEQDGRTAGGEVRLYIYRRIEASEQVAA